MYQVENEAMEAMIGSYCRTWRILLYDAAHGTAYMGEAVMSAGSDIQTSDDPENLKFGSVCSGQWSITLYNPDRIQFLGHEIHISLFLRSFDETDTEPVTWEYMEGSRWSEVVPYNWAQLEELAAMIGSPIPMGQYICVRSRTSGDTTELTLCDRLYFSDKPYVPNVTLPASSKEVELDILSQLGLEHSLDYYARYALADKNRANLLTNAGEQLTVGQYGFVIGSVPEDCTMRRMLGYIASAQGEFGFVDRLGRYTRKWYGDPVFTFDPNTIDLPTLSERSNRIGRIICGEFDTGQMYSDGQTMEFDNPYMTRTLFDSLRRRVQSEDYRWYTAEVRHILGDPRLDPGDTVVCSDGERRYRFPVTSLSYGFDGGLWAEIRAVGMDYEQEVSANG